MENQLQSNVYPEPNLQHERLIKNNGYIGHAKLSISKNILILSEAIFDHPIMRARLE